MNYRFFHSWVPQKLDMWLLLFLSIMLALNSGIPSTVNPYIVGARGFMPADVAMAGFAYFCGMSCVFPLSLRITHYTAPKGVLCTVIPIVILLNYVLSVTDIPFILVMVSWMIGFLKMVATLRVVISLWPIWMPKGERFQLYSFYYPLALILGPLAGLFAVYLAQMWSWEISIHAQNIFLFIGLLIILFLASPEHKARKVPLYQYDWFGTAIYSITMLLVCYVLTYGLTEDWYNSHSIQVASIGILLFGCAFIKHCLTIKRPLVNLRFIRYWKPMLGIFIFLLLGFFSNTNILFDPFMEIIHHNDSFYNAQVYCYAIPGTVVGALFSYIYYRKYTGVKIPLIIASLCFLITAAILYSLIGIDTAGSLLFMPLFFRSVGTIVTFIAVGVYITNNTPAKYMNDVISAIIMVRSFLSPLLVTTIYSNLIYRGSVGKVNMLAGEIDGLNPFLADRGDLFQSVKTQALLLSLKDLYGGIVLLAIVVLLFVILFPFQGSHKRAVLNWRNPKTNKELAGSIIA